MPLGLVWTCQNLLYCPMLGCSEAWTDVRHLTWYKSHFSTSVDKIWTAGVSQDRDPLVQTWASLVADTHRMLPISKSSRTVLSRLHTSPSTKAIGGGSSSLTFARDFFVSSWHESGSWAAAGLSWAAQRQMLSSSSSAMHMWGSQSSKQLHNKGRISRD